MWPGFCGSQLTVSRLPGNQSINHSTVSEDLEKLRSRQPLPNRSVSASGLVADSLVDKAVAPVPGCFQEVFV